MGTIRQSQIAELIKRNFSVVLQEEGSLIYGREGLVTVTEVQMTPDFGLARIYLSIFGTENKQGILLMMNQENTAFRTALGKRIKSQVRRIPHIEFFVDETMDEMYRIDQMFKKIEHDEQEIQKNILAE